MAAHGKTAEHGTTGDPMNDEAFTRSIRKLLKEAGVTGHQKAEAAVRQAVADGKTGDDAALDCAISIEIPSIGFSHVVAGKLDLE